MRRHYMLALALLCASCSASRPVPPPECKLSLVYCPAGYRCDIGRDVCVACSDGGPCDDAGVP